MTGSDTGLVPSAGGAVGSGDYTVKQGDCLSSIAQQTGHLWTTIWNHPSNSELKKIRKDPNVLLPGDQLFIPELATKKYDCATDACHTFELKTSPIKLRLQFFKEGKPRAQERFSIDIDGRAVAEGKLDQQGGLEVPISPNAEAAHVLVGDGQNATEHAFVLGGVDPITEVSGIQQRLRNLGFNCEPSGQLDEMTRSALSLFQRMNGLQTSGESDESTRNKLLQVHGC